MKRLYYFNNNNLFSCNNASKYFILYKIMNVVKLALYNVVIEMLFNCTATWRTCLWVWQLCVCCRCLYVKGSLGLLGVRLTLSLTLRFVCQWIWTIWFLLSATEESMTTSPYFPHVPSLISSGQNNSDGKHDDGNW